MLPKRYAWLDAEPAPRMLREALGLYGTLEKPGKADNPTILAWAKEVGLDGSYKNDATAWCGLFMAVAARRAGWEFNPKGNALWARNWAFWGEPADEPMLGDILVFPRGSGGHVAIYVGEDDTHFHILGGNQSDRVSIVRKAKKPLIAARRAAWHIAQPANVRRVFLDAKGPVAGKEA